MPLHSAPPPDLEGKPVLLVSGRADPIAPFETVEPLRLALSESGARVEHEVLPVGHALTRSDLEMAQRWLGTHRPS